jgi:hypothetical protein
MNHENAIGNSHVGSCNDARIWTPTYHRIHKNFFHCTTLNQFQQYQNHVDNSGLLTQYDIALDPL